MDERHEPVSPFHRSWRRFRANRLAGTSALFLLILTLGSLLILPFSSSWYAVQDIENAVRALPSWNPRVSYDRVRPDLERGWIGERIAAFGPAMHHASAWMGYDAVGRSLFYRTLLGWLISLSIGLSAAVLAVTVGVLWGSVAALSGGLIDSVLMRIVDVLYGLPYILMVILLQISLREPLRFVMGRQDAIADVTLLVVAIGSVSWLTMARVIRGQILALRSQTFIDAARVLGAGPWRILRRHLLPNLVGPIIVYATLIIPQAILQESFLSFLGIGIQQPTPSLGRLTSDGVYAVNPFVGFWWLLTYPSGLLLLTLLALNFVGDGLRDAFDPKSTAATVV